MSGSQGETCARPTWRGDLPVALGLMVFVLVAYSLSLFSGFVYDDHHFVVKNVWIRSWQNFVPLTTTIEANATTIFDAVFWRPLRNLSFALDYSLFGLAAWAFHLGNVLWHSVAVAGVYALIRDRPLPQLAAVLGAVAFAIHPAQVESVAWIKERDGLMAGAFLVWALFFGFRESARSAIASAVLLSLALLSKESTIVYVPILAGFMVLQRGRRMGALLQRDAILLATAVVLAGVYLWIRVQVVGHMAQRDTPLGGTVGGTLLTMLGMYTRYAGIVLAGRGMLLDYSHIPALGAGDATVMAGGVLLLATVAGLGWLVWGAAHREAGLALGIFVAALLPFANIIPMMQWMAVRFLYLPMIGVALGVALLAEALRTKSEGRMHPMLAGMLLPAWLAICGILNLEQQLIWRNDLTLWGAAHRDAPESSLIRQSYAGVLYDNGQLDRAAEVMRDFDYRDPLNRRPYVGFLTAGVIAYYREDLERAEAILTGCITHFPDNAEAYNYLGDLMFHTDRAEQATELWRRAIAIDPHNRIAVGCLATSSTDPEERQRMAGLLERMDTLPAAQW